MTVEPWTIAPQYTVAGIGPYAIPHPYASGAIQAFVIVNGARVVLADSDRSLSPVESMTEGNLFLTPAAAATHAGRALIIDRVTPDQQGWLGVLGEREAGLEAQLDLIVQAVQELRVANAGALRIRGMLDAFDWTDGTVPLRSGTRVISGPTAAEITAAQTRANEAAASAVAAAASAASALAKQNSMLRWRNAWATATAYAPSDIVFSSGSAYVCVTGHTSGVFATDLAAVRWAIFAQQGASGVGSGDMLKSDNLSLLTNYPLARTNLGLQALATKATAAFADIDPAAIITAVETLSANKTSDVAVPTAKATAEYVDARAGRILLADKTIANFGAITFPEFNNALYSFYEFEFDNVKPATDATDLRCRFSSNGGSSYDSGASDYEFAIMGFQPGTSLNEALDNQAFIALTPSTFGVGSAAPDRGISGNVKIYGANDGGGHSRILTHLSADKYTDTVGVFIGTGVRRASAQTNALRFYMSAGNIAAGRIRMYGFN
jgi:hypothetical protein